MNTLNTPVEISYKLAIPTKETITIPNIQLNENTKYITVGTDVTPSKIEVEI